MKICLIIDGIRGISLSIVKKLIEKIYKIFSFNRLGESIFTNYIDTNKNIQNIINDKKKIYVFNTNLIVSYNLLNIPNNIIRKNTEYSKLLCFISAIYRF